MKTIVAIILLSFTLTVNTGYSQTFGWAKSIGGDTYDTERGYAIDKDGASKTYAIGNFNGTISLGSFTLAGTNDIYIAKYNLSGAVQWAVKAGGPGMDIGYDIACDNSGNSYITGYYTGTATFGSYSLTSTGSNDIFIAKYNSLGVCQWAKSEGGINSETGKKIAIDNSGNIYVTGDFSNNLTIGASTVTSIGYVDIFLAKYSSAGDFIWLVSGGGGGNDFSSGVTADASGNVYLNCFVYNTANFSGHLIYINNIFYDNCVYVKYNSSGDFVWGYKYSFSDISVSSGISVDSYSNCYTLCNQGLRKHDTNGNLIWERQFWASARGLSTDIFGNSYICGSFQGTGYFPPYTINSSGNNHDIFVAKYNTDGIIEWVISAGGSGNDIAFDIISDLVGNAFITGEYSGTVNFGSTTLSSLGSKDAFTAKINPQTNLITGKVFFDYNNNGIYDDATENGFQNIIVSQSPGTLNVNSNSSGDYTLFCGTGPYTLNIPFPPLYYTANPVSHSVNFTGYGNVNENNDFGFYPTANVSDLRINLTDIARTRAGFNTSHLLAYQNVGTFPKSGSITLQFDNDLDIISINAPGATERSRTSYQVIWDYYNLFPNEFRSIEIVYSVPTTEPNGTILSSSATILPNSDDITPANNVYNLNQVVTGSFDPNDKSVDPVSNLTLQNILDEDSLTYTIRFQNTGTDTAFTVKVTDTLSSKLNIPSIETVASSHDYDFSIKNGNILVWTFNNILLPDSTTNEVKSHGFVKYRIKPKNTLTEGDVIKNSANIYFDFNVPVITNTTVTRVGTSIKYLDLGFRLEAMYPHPDSIKVCLAKSVSPFEIIDTSMIFSQLNGSQFRAISSFRNAVAGTSYYIIIKHRNSIETWSANPVVFNPDTAAYDFTTAVSKAFGNNMVMINGEASFYTGETEDDGLIDMSDVIRIYNDAIVFKTGDNITDLNGDDLIDLSDLLFAINNTAKFVVMLKP